MIFGVVGGVILFVVLVLLGILAFFSKYYHRVEQGKALIINKSGQPSVSFTTSFVLPLFHRAETMDISVKTIEIDRRGKEGLICQDNIRADIKVTFFVRVNKTREDVLKVASAIGCLRASAQSTLEELFNAKFSEALKTVGKQLDFVDLYTKRDDFKDRIIEVIGRDLNGYVLEDAAIDFLEQTAVQSLDSSNILDAQGIRKITELTAAEHVRTNQFSNNERKLIRKQDVETVEAILELDRQKSDAEFKQRREIATVQAREAAETASVQAEEKRRAELARIKAQEEIQVSEENKCRQVEVAQKNRERVVGIETERVMRDRALEAIARERETELLRIDKEKQLERERKEIAEVIRERVSVEKSVAQEEEAIKTLRVVEDANRKKDARVIGAEADATEQLVVRVKAADAGEQAAKHEAKRRIHLAEAELEAADKTAQSKVRLAEGARAEQAASGLAAAQVREADAQANEKFGLAEARVHLEKLTATAKGKEAAASATEKMGVAEAVAAQKMGEAQAVAAREMGLAEATAIESKLKGEASGLADKATAMKALDEASRGHEEFRIKLAKEKDVELEAIRMRQHVAEAQAMAMAEAFKSANIDIVGGDGEFFDKMVGAVTLGKSTDGFFAGSDVATTMLKDYFDGTASLPADLKEILARPKLGSEDFRNMSVAAVLGKLASGASEADRDKLAQLVEAAKSLGLTGKPSA